MKTYLCRASNLKSSLLPQFHSGSQILAPAKNRPFLRFIQEQEGMEERLGEMRKGRRERMRKGAIVSSSPQGMTSWSSSIKIWFFLAYRMHY